MKSILFSLLTGCLFLSSCNNAQQEKKAFNPELVKPLIQRLSLKWSIGTTTQNIDTLSSIYDEHAHYVPDMASSKHGNTEITKYWKESLKYVKECKLTMESLEGTKEILYETGHGYSLIVNEKDEAKRDTFRFKYVNVWKLQPDESYKVVIDTYNDIEPSKK